MSKKQIRFQKYYANFFYENNMSYKEILTFMSINDYARDDGSCTASVTKIGKAVGMNSRVTTTKHIESCVKKGVIVKVDLFGSPSNIKINMDNPKEEYVALSDNYNDLEISLEAVMVHATMIHFQKSLKCNKSVSELSKFVGMSISVVRKSINELIEKDFIRIIKGVKDGHKNYYEVIYLDDEEDYKYKIVKKYSHLSVSAFKGMSVLKCDEDKEIRRRIEEEDKIKSEEDEYEELKIKIAELEKKKIERQSTLFLEEISIEKNKVKDKSIYDTFDEIGI